LKVLEINDVHHFLELKDEWNRVLARSKDNNIFLTWEYLSTFWKHFGKKARLRILLCINHKEEIISIAPLRQSRYDIVGPFGYNVIEPLGYRGLMPEGGDYTGLILGEKEAECFKLFLNYLIEHDNWDFIYLYDIPATSAIPDIIYKTSEPITKFEITNGAICPYISLPNSIEILISRLSKNLRQNLRKYQRRLKRDFIKVEFKSYEEYGSVNDAMTIFFDLHQRRWKLKGMPGVFSTQEVRNFYIDVARLFAKNGWLALYFLTVNDEPIGATYSVVYNHKAYFCLGGFDPSYSKYSIGHLLHLKTMEICIAKKIKEYDFLKGGEPYKFVWTKHYRRNINIKFVNNKITSKLYHQGIKTIKQIKIDKTLETLSIFNQKRRKH